MAFNPDLAHINTYVGRAIVRDDIGRLLLVQRLSSADNDPELWEFSGGGYDVGRGDRCLADTSLREMSEETGLLGALRLKFMGSLLLEDRPLRPTHKEPNPVGDYWAEGYEIEVVGGTEKPQLTEVQRLHWFHRDDLPGLPITDSTRSGLIQMRYYAPFVTNLELAGSVS